MRGLVDPRSLFPTSMLTKPPHPSPSGPPSPPRGEGYLARPGSLIIGDQQVDLSASRSLPGRHNAQNAAFAYAAARAVGVSHDQAVAGLLSFPGLAHRMEAVGRLGEGMGPQTQWCLGTPRGFPFVSLTRLTPMREMTQTMMR